MGAQKSKTVEESDDNSIEDLPDGWLLTSVGELFQIVGGGTPSTKNPEYWEGDIPWISSADIYGLKKIVPRRNINLTAIKNSAAHLVPKGSIIVVTRVSLGRIAMCDTPISFSQDCHALIPKTDSIDPEFALFYLSQAVQTFQSQSRGTTISGVTVKVVSSLPFPLPPLAEQQRIVARVEALLTHINAARVPLIRVPLIMRRFRQAVLAAAFNGKLTEDLRKEKNNTEMLPEGWKIKKLRDTTKRALTIKPESEPDRIFGYVDISSINNDMNKISDFKKIRGEDAPSRARQSIQPYDVLFSNVRTYLRNIAMVPDDLDVQLCSTGFTVLRSNGTLLPKFLFYYTLTNDFINVVTPQQTGSNYPATTDRVVKDATIPLPPLAEQHEIIRRVGLLFERADAFDQEVAAAGRRCERLTQAVLGKAFRGELTTHDSKAPIIHQQ
jgi:type I restriction enzyme S subunit